MAKRSGWSLFSGRAFALILSAFSLCLLVSPSALASYGRTAGTFNVSGNGAATYTIPLFTPPGPRGVQPSVALTYSSNAGIGFLGRGWSLSGFSSILRCNRTMAQDGWAASPRLYSGDGYCLDGNRLRVQSGTYGAAGSVYYTEIADFSRITANSTAGAGPQSWTVERKDGLIYTYGGTSDSRVLATHSYLWTPTVTTWMVSEIRDRAGNKVKFTWKSPDATTYGTTHPVKIEWTQTSAGSGSYLYSMDFHYTAGGNAPASTPVNFRWWTPYYTTGPDWANGMKDADLLTSITVSVGGTVKRNYLLGYGSSPTTTAKRLTQVTECSDSGASDCLSPTTLSYQDGATGVNTSSPLLSLSGDISAADGSYDFDGNGVRDIAYNLSGTWHVRLGSVASGYGSAIDTGVTTPTLIAGKLLGNHADQLLGESGGTWYMYAWNSTSQSFDPTSTGITTAASAEDIVLSDVNADGREDVVYVSAAGHVANSAYLVTPDWLPLYVRYNTTSGGSLSFTAPYTYALDAYFFPVNEGTEILPMPPVWSEYHEYWEGFGVGFMLSTAGVKLSKGGDVNGDGRQELNLTYGAQGCVFWVGPDPPSCIEYLDNGGSEWGYQTSYIVQFTGDGPTLAPTFSHPTPNGTGTLLDADFNGDGCDDFLIFDFYIGEMIQLSACESGGVGVYFVPSIGYGGYVGAADWTGDGNDDQFQFGPTALDVRSVAGDTLTDPVDTGLPCWVVIRTDGNGDGLDDIGCLYPGWSLTIYPHNDSNTVPDLLASVVDGFGVSHTPTYTAIEHSNYVAYDDAVYPSRDLTRGRVVVKKVTATDGTGTAGPSGGTFDTDYTYFGAQVNVQGRGFAGFEKIQAVDSRNGVMREQHFKREFPSRGMTAEESVYQSVSGSVGVSPISKRTVTTSSRTLDSTLHNERYFPYVEAISEEGYEVGGTANGLQIFGATTTNTYGDDWGNLTASTRVVTDMDAGSPQNGETWTTTTTQTLSPDTTHWCLGLPTASSVTRSSTAATGGPITQTLDYALDYNFCRHTAETVASGTALQVDHSWGNDVFGNMNSEVVVPRDENGTPMTPRWNYVTWGSADGTLGGTGVFPVKEENALGQITYRTFDSTFGTLKTQTDPNGVVVASNDYDAFGRLERSTRADGTSTALVRHLCASACENADPGSGGDLDRYYMEASEQVGASTFRTARTHFDLFDRPIVQYDQLLSGGYSRVGRQYDDQGRVEKESAPCEASSCTVYWTENTYDLLGRLTRQERPSNDGPSPETATTIISYAGRTQEIVDPEGKHTLKILDVNGGMRRSQDHDGYYQDFAYDAAGNLTAVTDSLSNPLFTASYAYGGIKPFQTATTDMDLGSWSYTYNSLGELVEWQDAKSQTFSQTYDLLSRVTSRTEAEGTTTWTWGTNPVYHSIGLVQSVAMTDPSSNPVYSEVYDYFPSGALGARVITIAGDQTYEIYYGYNAQGLLDSVAYPLSTSSTRVQVKYGYAYGILQSVTDWYTGSGTVYWTADAQNVRGQTTQETLGNGVVTSRSFDAVTGQLSYIRSGPSIGVWSLQNQSYAYDLVGNVTQRQESSVGSGLTENFCYDNLYRLRRTQLGGGDCDTPTLELQYHPDGNIKKRTDVNGNAEWEYHATKKHAVLNTGSGGSAYSYDANGNMTTRAGSSISWSSFNYPTELATATESTEFSYGPGRQYYKQEYTGPSGSETTHYVGGILEKVSDGTTTDWRHYISAGGQVVAIVSRKSDSTNAVYYPLGDNQGSGSTLTDASGTNLVRESFTAFGLPRDGSDWDGSVSSGDKAIINGISRRGYTGHSMLGDMGLIHMNGRVQDAVTGRFLSPDPNVFNPGFTQSFNRYAYVNNNPLSFIDPSGFAICANFKHQVISCDWANENYDAYYCYDGVGDDYLCPTNVTPRSCDWGYVVAGEAGHTWCEPGSNSSDGNPGAESGGGDGGGGGAGQGNTRTPGVRPGPPIPAVAGTVPLPGSQPGAAAPQSQERSWVCSRTGRATISGAVGGMVTAGIMSGGNPLAMVGGAAVGGALGYAGSKLADDPTVGSFVAGVIGSADEAPRAGGISTLFSATMNAAGYPDQLSSTVGGGIYGAMTATSRFRHQIPAVKIEGAIKGGFAGLVGSLAAMGTEKLLAMACD